MLRLTPVFETCELRRLDLTFLASTSIRKTRAKQVPKAGTVLLCHFRPGVISLAAPQLVQPGVQACQQLSPRILAQGRAVEQLLINSREHFIQRKRQPRPEHSQPHFQPGEYRQCY